MNFELCGHVTSKVKINEGISWNYLCGLTSMGGEEMEKMIMENYWKVWWKGRKDELDQGKCGLGEMWIKWEPFYRNGEGNFENVRDIQKRNIRLRT